jgi:hypothetical protein
MDLAAQLTTIETLRARPFPERRVESDDVVSGPGYHTAELETSEDFWEDDGSRRLQARDDYEAACQALIDILSGRWGAASETLDLTPYLERSAFGGEPLPPVLEWLSGFAAEAYGWRIGGRWIGVAVGQRGEQLPWQLVAAIADDEAVP